MSCQIVMTVEVIDPYSAATLAAFGIESGTADEYAFCLGWQDGALNHMSELTPVTGDYLLAYRSGWALGSLNRMVWLFQGARQAVAKTG